MVKDIINEIKEQETAEFRYNGEIKVSENSEKPHFSGSIETLTMSNIELGYNPKYLDDVSEIERIVKEPFKEAFSSLTKHELNHKGGGKYKGCPRNLDLHVEQVLTPMSQKLKDLGFGNTMISMNQSLYDYFANMFEDFVDNSEIGNKSEHIGMFVMYKDDAQTINDKRFTPLFEAFVSLQEKFYGAKRSQKLLKSHYAHNEKAEKAVENFLKRTGLENYKRKVHTKKGEQIVFDKRGATHYLINEANWNKLSIIMAEEFSKLIDKNQMQNPEYVKKNFVSLKGEQDGFSKEMNSPDVKMKFAYRGYKEGEDEFCPPPFMDSYDALDLVYQRIARNMEIKANSSTSVETMPMMWYGKRPFDERTDKMSKARVGINRDGALELRVKRYHEDDNVEFTERQPNIPEIKFVMLDTSRSTRKSVDGVEGKVMNPWVEEKKQWTDHSIYHHELVAWYGLLELLRKQGTLKHTNVKFANYSSSTYTADNLKDSKKLALTPQFGGTYLDLEKTKKLFGQGQLIISLSDGDMGNWDAIKTEFINKAKKNEYFHLQIGNPTEMSLDLEKAGLRVVYDNGQNLGKIVIDLTKPYIIKQGGRK